MPKISNVLSLGHEGKFTSGAILLQRAASDAAIMRGLKGYSSMKKYVFLIFAAVIGIMSIVVLGRIDQSVHAQGNTGRDFVPPTVFQAAGPDAASIQSSVDGFRAALGIQNNGNNPGPLSTGHRE